MKNITEEAWNVIIKFLGGDKTEGDCVHGLSGTLNSDDHEGWSPLRDRLQEAVDSGDVDGACNFEDMNEETREVFLDQLRECISLASEHGLIEVTGIDDEGDFVYALTDKCQKLNKLFTLPEGASEVEYDIIHGRDDWMIEILKDMGVFEQP